VGGQFVRYDVALLHVYRFSEGSRAELPAVADDHLRRHLERGDTTTCLPTATAFLGLSKRAVVKLLQSGAVAATKAHGQWEIDIASLRAYAARRKEREP
jgi:hypothetical protein